MLLPHFGSMSHEETIENIDRIAKDVLPHLRGVWDDEGWENHWWPENCKQPASTGSLSTAPWRKSVTKPYPSWGASLNIRVDVAGSGEPLVFLHSAGGLNWDPFLLGLAEKYTVYAPYFPGTYPGRAE